MNKLSESELCLIWLDSFLGLEYKHKLEIYKSIEKSDKIKNVIEKNKDYIVSKIGESDYNLILSSSNADYLNYVLEGLDKNEVTPITLFSNDYPLNLKQTDLPPLVLYCKGDLSLLKDEIFGIVGSRKSIPLSVKLCEDYTKTLSNSDFTLITGIAEGIDETVIKTCLDNNKKVISVLAGGFNNVYPKSNEMLFKRVCKSGLCISEYPPDVVPKPFMFPVRNRIIAGLSKGVLIVSAGIKSGTIYTAEYAEEYGRNVFAIPYNVGISVGVGTNDLIKRFAILTDSPQDILEYYGIKNEELTEDVTKEEKDVLSVLKDGEVHIDKLSTLLNKSVSELMITLSMLEIKGLVTKTGINVYGLIKKC